MSIETALWIVAIAVVLIGTTIWLINAAEQRIRHMVREGLNRPDDGHTAALLRSRALDDEYRALVLEAHNEGD